MREARVKPKLRHLPAMLGNPFFAIEGPKLLKQLHGLLVRCGWRRIKPRQLVRRARSPSRQLHCQRRQIRLEHFRRRALLQQPILRFAPEPVANAGRRTPGTPPPLVSGVTGRAHRNETAHAGTR
ncbi:hypothetical protein D3C77_504330 [compost metagenome]